MTSLDPDPQPPAKLPWPRELRRLGFGPRQGLLWLGLVVLFASLSTLYSYLGGLADGGEVSWSRILLREMTGWLTFGLLFFPLLFVVRRYPPKPGRWAHTALLYAATIVVLGLVHTTLMWQTRKLVYPLLGFGAYDYGVVPMRYAMELAGQVQGFTFLIAGILATEALRRAREQEVRTAQLEGSLAQAELNNLRLQLQPHFLFNALNTISATMYDDPVAADEMLDQLSTLLRASLKTVRTDAASLGEELEVLDAYIAILRARFGGRLNIRLEIDEATRQMLVPSMMLQPLVENAVRHGGIEQRSTLQVTVRSEINGERLRLWIEDDGPGGAAYVAARDGLKGDQFGGVGLGSLRERLRLIYGDNQSLDAGAGPHGFSVAIVLPLERREQS